MEKLKQEFEALGDDPDHLPELVGRADQSKAEKLRDLFRAVGSLLDAADLPQGETGPAQ